MLLGDRCTRECSFCAVAHYPGDGKTDAGEPERVAGTVRSLGLKYVVLTMVARDDLPDNGAGVIAETIHTLDRECPGTQVEVLTSDLGGSPESLKVVLDAHPAVFGHNVETVRRLTAEVRDRRASYDLSLNVLKMAKTMETPANATKSSLMLGLGESRDEVAETLGDLREAKVDIVTLGQYLKPGGEGFHKVERYVTPKEFAEFGDVARSLGFKGVASGPMVRSSYMAEELCRASAARE
jgi:lipoic acid synthetase